MDLKPWNPWKEVARAEEEASRLLDAALAKLRSSLPGNPIAFVPPVDIVEGDDEYRVYVALPGAVEEDVDIAVERDVLVVRGELEPPYSPRGVTVHERQWRYGYFERRIRLPRAVGVEEIRASYEDGVLAIFVPKGGGSGEKT